MNNSVTIQFSTTKNVWSWRPPFFPNWASFVIRHMTHSPFSHCDFELPDGTLLGASDSPKAPIISGNSRGVALRPSHYEDYGLRRRMQIKTDKADAIIAFAMAQIGKPFDNSALYSFWSDAAPGERDWHNPDMWFCAELVVCSIEAAGFWSPVPAQWPKNRISPPDIFMMLLFDPRWINSATFWTDPKYLRG
jgi:hypothetical protein